jgi:hypothetical protein
MSRKLPFWRTVSQSYALTIRNGRFLLRLSWAWMLITAPVLFALEYAYATLDWIRLKDGGFVYMLLSSIVVMPMLSSIAVAWHRRLLREELPPPGPYLRLDRRVLRYGLAGLAISLLTFGMWASFFAAVYAIPSDLATVDVSAIAVAIAASVALFSVVTYVSTRLGQILPHFALDLDDAQALDGWRAARGSVWRLFLGLVLVMAVATAVNSTISFFTIFGPLASWDAAPKVAIDTGNSLIYSALLAIPSVTFLSLSYSALVEKRDTALRV